MKVASVSQLKNSLSAHLQAVQRGDPCLVTDRRKPVAVIHPVSADAVPADLQDLVAAGQVSTSGRVLDVKAFLRRPKARCAGGLTAVVLREREGR